MRVVVIGSFRRHYATVVQVARAFQDLGCEVLSPGLGAVVNVDAEFIVLDTDRHGSVRAVQDHVLRQIDVCDLVYLATPDGYVGHSAVLELGYAHGVGKALYALARPQDATLPHYLHGIGGPAEVLAHLRPGTARPAARLHLLFDADDTLWDDQGSLQAAERAVEALVDRHHGAPSDFQRRFIEVERRNIPVIGFGFHSYLYSLAEAFHVEARATPAAHELHAVVRALVDRYLHDPPTLFPDVDATLRALAERGHRLHVVSRGVPAEQRGKLSRAGLTERFETIHIVPRKDAATYRAVAETLGVPAGRCVMIGNSVKSDILPAMAAGMGAVHIPPPTAWALDHAAESVPAGCVELPCFAALLEHFAGSAHGAQPG